MSGNKKVAIVGAGCSGITAIKSCLEEGLQPVCFERTNIMGGLWYFKEQESEKFPDESSVNRSTVINTSKEMMAFSDYPLRTDYPNFVHNTQVLQYFRDYVKKFDLEKYIQYDTEVLLTKRAPDFDQSGRWLVTTRNHKTGKEHTDTYDAVLVCSGHHAIPNKPDFPGLKDFQGRVIHSKEYKDTRGFEGKRILVIGIGNSGGDCAVELAKYSWVLLSTRRGAWVQNRIGPQGMPKDISNTRRWNIFKSQFIPTSVFLWLWKKQLNSRFDHDLYGMTPEFEPNATHPTVNDDLANRVAAGMIKVKTDIKRFTKTGCEFIDGTYEDNIDTVILATGYKIGFPMVEKGVIDVKDNKLELYKHVFSPNVKQPTIAFIGNIQPLGSIIPIAELQCRVATRVFKGLIQLPSSDEMWSRIKERQATVAERYVKSNRHTIQVDWIPYCDEIAEMMGAKPNLVKLWVTDPKLAYHVFFGPCTPYQYRLNGPHTWPEARETIISQMDRVAAPLATRPLPRKAGNQSLTGAVLFIALLIPVLLYIIQILFSKR